MFAPRAQAKQGCPKHERARRTGGGVVLRDALVVGRRRGRLHVLNDACGRRSREWAAGVGCTYRRGGACACKQREWHARAPRRTRGLGKLARRERGLDGLERGARLNEVRDGGVHLALRHEPVAPALLEHDHLRGGRAQVSGCEGRAGRTPRSNPWRAAALRATAAGSARVISRARRRRACAGAALRASSTAFLKAAPSTYAASASAGRPSAAARSPARSWRPALESASAVAAMSGGSTPAPRRAMTAWRGREQGAGVDASAGALHPPELALS